MMDMADMTGMTHMAHIIDTTDMIVWVESCQLADHLSSCRHSGTREDILSLGASTASNVTTSTRVPYNPLPI